MAQLPVPAHPLVPAPPVLARVPVRAPVPPSWQVVVALTQLPVLVPLVLAALPVLAHLVVEPAGVVEQFLLNRQSFSAGRARTSP